MQDISLEQAIEVLLEHTKKIERTEEVPILEALGRVLAEDAVASFDNPPFDRSPLDGYTFASGRTKGATKENPASFAIIGEECAGDFFAEAVPAGSALRLMTGAAIPRGCDCVVRQEDVTIENGRLLVPYELHHHENYCFAGEDVKKGTLLVKKGTELTAAHLGVLASLGFGKVKVLARPRIAIASTGDELVLPGEPLQPGKIYNSNLYVLAGRLQEMGFRPEVLGILPDDVNEAAAFIDSWRGKVDLFLTTGGVSVGKKDIMHGVVKKIGTRLFWRVCIKPGAPVIAYTAGDMLGIALSGNPFASYATFELLVRQVLSKFSGRTDVCYTPVEGYLADKFPKPSYGRRFIRAHYADGVFKIPSQHDSGSLFSAAGCNALIDIPAGTGPLPAGSRVKGVLL
ncbi:molybdopterin molybdotransferase MoeA [Mitsuokella sp. WILCCON 0060]|uniref:molybdopterin molybdotransferase MoeA n=1 Tax=Mitsuokella sp. WILCCON 0060 TaxID=3345341 RepID=UPI003F195CB4